MSQLNLSLMAVAEDLSPLMWPALAGFGGAQFVVVHRVSSGAEPPRPLVVAGFATAVGCCAAIALNVAQQLNSTPLNEEGFSYAGFIVWEFVTTMWPVLVAFGVAESLLLLQTRFQVRWLAVSAALISGVTASWMVAWWLYVGPQGEAMSRFLLSRLWALGVLACGVGFVLSMTTFLIGTRLTFARTTPA